MGTRKKTVAVPPDHSWPNEVVARHFFESAQTTQAISGLTHDYYKYPARFSPTFAAASIEAFTQPGDLVLDPFVGGGTTLVEASVRGRKSIGLDISSLASFVASVKTTPLGPNDVQDILIWALSLKGVLKMNLPAPEKNSWHEKGYLKHLSKKGNWRIRKILELAVASVEKNLETKAQQNFARCALLRTAQWALDCKKESPTLKSFRQKLDKNISEMLAGMAEYMGHQPNPQTTCINHSVIGCNKLQEVIKAGPPKLIVTSPPYPGVHVLYHRWQINGRRETAAPFWLANQLDGAPLSFYAAGPRKQPGCTTYFANMLASWEALAKIANHPTLVVQLIAFSQPEWQLPAYLQVMKAAGFVEAPWDSVANYEDGRLWREVPNRKWYATYKGSIPASKEVVLFHRLASRS